MRSNWEGNRRLQDFVRRIDSGAGLVAEVVAVADEDVRRTPSEWDAGTDTGSIETLATGGVRLGASTATLAEHTTDDATQITALAKTPPFDALFIEWLGNGASELEFNSFTARLDPRADGGQPKTVAEWVLEVWRITRRVGADEIHAALIVRSAPVAATGEVAADFTFPLRAGSGRFHIVGEAPEGGENSRPQTLFRVIPYDADGAVADNVAWLADSAEGSSKTEATYIARHYSIIAATNLEEAQQGGAVLEIGGLIESMPRFNLLRSNYAQGSVEFTGAADFDALAGAGDIVVVARGEEWGDSALTYEIDDGGGYVECFDGDVVGVDNTPQGGADLSGVSTTGPWDMQVTLDPSTDNLRSPVVRELGLERVEVTSLRGTARVFGGARTVDPHTLKGNIAAAEIHILKTGEKDFRDYGSNLLSAYHIGEIEVRVYVGDPSGRYLDRSEWMLHSTWELEDYRSEASAHVLQVLSPLRRARTRIPPFVATSDNDGTRDAVTVSGTLQAAYDELLDSLVALPARYRGPGIEDATTTVSKTILDSDAKDELDALAYLDGSVVTESQGRIKVLKVMRPNPADDTPVAFFPLGSYTPRYIGPGYASRVDEFFVPYAWEDAQEAFDSESRHFNATAFGKFGGHGIATTQKLDAEIAKWIADGTLADTVGERGVKHSAYGTIVWELDDCPRNPHLEFGDVVQVETDLFVARSPIDDQPIRGRVIATAIVTGVHDPWARSISVWVPGFEYIAAVSGDVLADQRKFHTLRIPASAFGGGVGDLRPEATATPLIRSAPLILPPGSTITAFRSQCVRAGASDTAEVILWGAVQFLGSPPISTAIASVTHTHGVDANNWTTEETTGLSQSFLNSRSITVELEAASDVDDARFGWVEVDYRGP